jgi:hypothetical protein
MIQGQPVNTANLMGNLAPTQSLMPTGVPVGMPTGTGMPIGLPMGTPVGGQPSLSNILSMISK